MLRVTQSCIKETQVHVGCKKTRNSIIIISKRNRDNPKRHQNATTQISNFSAEKQVLINTITDTMIIHIQTKVIRR